MEKQAILNINLFYIQRENTNKLHFDDVCSRYENEHKDNFAR